MLNQAKNIFNAVRYYKYSMFYPTRLLNTRFVLNQIFIKFIQEGAVVIDAGANNGGCALFLSKLVGRQGRVLAFEPNPSKFAVLDKIAHQCWNRNITPFKIGLSDSKGTLEFYVDSRPPGQGSTFDPIQMQAEIDEAGVNYFIPESADVMRLDEIDLPTIDLIKLDIEGYELKALQGSQALISRDRPYIIFETFFNMGNSHYEKRNDELRAFFSNNGYEVSIFHVFGDDPKVLRDISFSTFDSASLLGVDAIAIPKEKLPFNSPPTDCAN